MTPDTLTSAVIERSGHPWCLFLDRDGVINTRIVDGYVRSWDEFAFTPGALDALATLARWAPRIVVVTNQQGVGKGLMSAADLGEIHERMRAEVESAGGRIDAIQVCPHLASADCGCRKPRPGMATDDLAAHPEIDGARSIVVGDSDSDIEMGRRLGRITGGTVVIRIGDTIDPAADATFPDLAAFARAVAEVADVSRNQASA